MSDVHRDADEPFPKPRQLVTPPPPPAPSASPYAPKPSASFYPSRSGVQDRQRLKAVATGLTELTFFEFMTICDEVVKSDGYKPPETGYELAALINAWARNEISTK